MKIDQLQYFVETARRQHIGQAARFLNISPSAISHSIAALEDEFGRTLFEKVGRQIKLTNHGKMLLDRAEFLLEEIGRLHEDLSSEQSTMRGHYRIAATHVLCSDFLVPAWVKIQKDNPILTSSIQTLRSGDIISKVISGEIDMGICFSPQSGPNFEQEVIHEGQLVLAFARKHPFLRDRKIEDLNIYPSIAALSAQGIENCENHPMYQKFRIQPKLINMYDSYDIAITMLLNSHAWTLLPDVIAQKYSSKIEIYTPKSWNAPYKISAVWPKFRVRTQALDFLLKEFILNLS